MTVAIWKHYVTHSAHYRKLVNEFNVTRKDEFKFIAPTKNGEME